jgi:SNF2 family DNA or RNA helicase
LINRYSSRRESISESLLNKKLKNAKSYDRIAGYFRSSIFEVSGESLDSVSGKIRVICNSELTVEDVKTAKAANSSLRREWCEGKPEEINIDKERLKKLYDYLKSGKLEVRVLPNDKFGLIHGKAGVITLENGEKTSFLGSVNESKTAWEFNYELVWEDNSPESVKWVQEEFDALWNDPLAKPLSDFVRKDIKRIAKRKVMSNVDEWKDDKDTSPAEVAVESPVYRQHLGLWDHQKYFIKKAYDDHQKEYGARYVLADQVGLGKTIQLAMSAQLMALKGDKPVLIIVPKTLMYQWQEELNELLDLPSAIWDGKNWIDENDIKYPNKGRKDIVNCPRRIGIISQGLITSRSSVCEELLKKKYECVIVDEAHRARRRNLGIGLESHTPDMNNLYEYLTKLSLKTHSMLLATATPMQMYPIELWDLLNILSQKNDSVLGSKISNWRKIGSLGEGLEIVMGKKEIETLEIDNWDWVRNPFPPRDEKEPKFTILRDKFNMKDKDFVVRKSYVELNGIESTLLGNLVTGGFFQNYNPYIRHVVRREREYLENKINDVTGEPYLQKIKVQLHGERDEDAIELTGYMKQAYEIAEKFCKLLSQRVRSGGLFKTLLLRRIGSSLEAGKNTGLKLLDEWNLDSNLFNEEDEIEEDNISNELKDLTEEETKLLKNFVDMLNSNQATDPKYHKIKELLEDQKWIEKGTIIFSQYFDSAYWIAKKLSWHFTTTPIALYAGGSKSGVFLDGEFKKESKEDIKLGVKKHKYKVMVGTDSAAEGLNLQALGTLINLDLPWNPTRLEQRKGRIQRIGQVNDTVHIYNMRYKDSVEDRVHELLSDRLQNITNVFGQLPDVLEDVWIEIAKGENEEAKRIIDNIPEKHPFEKRYNREVSYLDWESCSKVLDQKEKRKYFKSGW